MAKQQAVPRPTKQHEYLIVAGTTQAAKGWRDLKATSRNTLTDAWDFLTRTPLETTPTNYPLKGSLGSIIRDGKTFTRWQHKPSRGNGARIWFYVEGQTVYLEQVHTAHPHETA